MDKDLLLKLGATPMQILDKYICRYCGQDGLASPENWRGSVIDHFIPRKAGGSDEGKNLVTSCHYCNAVKGSKIFESVAAAQEYLRERRQKDTEHIKKIKQAFK